MDPKRCGGILGPRNPTKKGKYTGVQAFPRHFDKVPVSIRIRGCIANAPCFRPIPVVPNDLTQLHGSDQIPARAVEHDPESIGTIRVQPLLEPVTSPRFDFPVDRDDHRLDRVAKAEVLKFLRLQWRGERKCAHSGEEGMGNAGGFT